MKLSRRTLLATGLGVPSAATVCAIQRRHRSNIVEIGTSYGYSGLWLALALLGTKGRLTTFEIDERRQARARANFERAGELSAIDLVLGDGEIAVTVKKRS